MSSSWFLLLAALVLLGIIARYAGPAKNRIGEPVSIEHPVQQSTLLKVASFNIQTGKSLAGERDISRAAELLEQADVAGIQEVYAAGWLNTLGIGLSQTRHLMQGSKLAGMFAATRRRWFRDHRGNALLTGLPIESWHSVMLPDQSGKSFRNMMIAKMQWQGESFHFINTHLHTGKGRAEQLAMVMAEFDKYPRVILTGDFNCGADSDELRPYLASGKMDDAINLAGLDAHDQPRIDWILAKGFTVTDGQMIEAGVSDHPYYQVSLQYL